MASQLELVENPLVVIVGPTASGKTSLAIDLAESHGGEVICADSRTIYEGMNVGTAKPSKAERERVVHWGLDIAQPNQAFTVADFKQYAVDKIADIRARGKIPFLVGGSGLYVDSVIFDYQFGGRADRRRRQHLENLTLEELWVYCSKNNITLPENANNRRYVVRAIERNGDNLKRRTVPVRGSVIVGIATDKEVLRTRIEYRAEHILTNGVVEEAILLGEKYGWGSEAMTGNIYPLIRSYLQGVLTRKELERRFTVQDWRLAKRQLTWFRRNPYIVWASRDGAVPHIKSTLATK